jgi:hypothetical protein
MAKKKKTRKQKALADVRRQTETFTPHTATVTAHQPLREEQLTTATPHVSRPQKLPVQHAIATADYRYLRKDLRRTVILTVAILIIEFALKHATGI